MSILVFFRAGSAYSSYESSESVTQSVSFSSGKPFIRINVRLSHNHKLQADKKLSGVLLLSNRLLAKIVKQFSWVLVCVQFMEKKTLKKICDKTSLFALFYAKYI